MKFYKQEEQKKKQDNEKEGKRKEDEEVKPPLPSPELMSKMNVHLLNYSVD